MHLSNAFDSIPHDFLLQTLWLWLHSHVYCILMVLTKKSSFIRFFFYNNVTHKVQTIPTY